MAKLSARNRTEVTRYFDLQRGVLCALMSDGVTLSRTPYHGWREFRRMKTGQDLQTYLQKKVAGLHARAVSRPALQCKCEPFHDIRSWGEAGKVDPCPCPSLVAVTLPPAVAFDPDFLTLPSRQTLETWQIDSVCEAVDGCTVEPDGTCPHGSPSWLKALRLI